MKIALGDWGFFYAWIFLFNIIGIIFGKYHFKKYAQI